MAINTDTYGWEELVIISSNPTSTVDENDLTRRLL
jgi:hypothetical protein